MGELMPGGYRVTVGRRYGSHGRVSTEWEFAVPYGYPDGLERLRTLKALSHPGLVFQGALDDAYRANYVFSVRLDEHELSGLCFRYLTAWPHELSDCLAEIVGDMERKRLNEAETGGWPAWGN